MNRILWILAGLCFCLSSSVEARYGALYDLSEPPFAADIARRPGDILTIIVEEKATTTNDGTRNLNKKDEQEWELGKVFFPNFSFSTGLDDIAGTGTAAGYENESELKYTANAKNTSTHEFETEFQARIIEEVNEGQFYITGHRMVQINGKNTTLFISGVVRERDIQDNNTVKSSLIADAVIEIDSQAADSDLNPSIISQVLQLVFF